MADLIQYRMEIVGGPFDGAPGMSWRDDGAHPPPRVVLVGVCPGDGSCNSGSEHCARTRKKHTYYWLPDEGTAPKRATKYELQDSFIEPERMTGLRAVPGRAVYVLGGLLLPAGGDLEVELPDEREVVFAGDGAGGVYARVVPQVRELIVTARIA
jgi:hypothetical protein